MIETDRMRLIRLEEEHAALILAFYIKNAEFLKAFEPVKPDEFYDLTYQENAIRAELIKESHGRSVKFLLTLKEEPRIVIGMVTINEIVRGCFQSCFLGYKIDRDYQNQGLMTEAVKSVVNYAFSKMKLHRIEANIMPRNKPSIKVVSKAGFYEEGIAYKYLKINDIWEDHIHMVILNDQV